VRKHFLLFVLLCAVYHSNLRPIASGDSLGTSLIPFSVVLDGSIRLDRFGPHIAEHVRYADSVVRQRGEQWYSVYPIAGPVLTAPLYLPLAVVPGVRELPPGTLIAVARIVEKAVAVFLAAGAAVLLLVLLRRMTTEGTGWLLTLVFALGTANWSTASQALWQHTYGQVAIIGCLYAIHRFSAMDASRRWFWMAGICAGAALMIRPTNVVLIPALLVALWLRPARALQYVWALVPVAAAGFGITLFNRAVFGSLAGGYSAGLDGDLWSGLAGILFSPGRGLLVYTPVLIFALAAVMPGSWKLRREHRSVVGAAAVIVTLQIALIARWAGWWGGYCWGPRLLTEICAPAVVLMAAGAPVWQRPVLQRVFVVLAVYSCFIQAVGVYCYPKGRWDHLPVTVNRDPGRLWDWRDNPIGRTVRGGVAWEPYAIVGAAVRGGLPAGGKKLNELGINPY
jgi:hypothetical protein